MAYELANLVAADIGFGFSNLVDGLGNEVSFRSCVIKTNDDELANFRDATGMYCVGENALDLLNGQKNSPDTQYFSSDEFRIQMLFGLQQLQKKQGRGRKNDWVLITGLPVEFYQDVATGHKARIKQFDKNLKDSPFTINQVKLIEQPKGTLWAPSLLNADGEPVQLYSAGKVGIVDIGDGTLDIIEGIRGKLNSNGRSKGMTKGCSTIHSSILTALRRKYRLDSSTSVHHIDYAIRSGTAFDVGAEDIDLRESKFFATAVKEYVEELKTTLQSLWQAYNSIQYLAITGGGAQLIPQDLFLKHSDIPHRKLVFGASDTNVKGYMNFLVTGLRHKGLLNPS